MSSGLHEAEAGRRKATRRGRTTLIMTMVTVIGAVAVAAEAQLPADTPPPAPTSAIIAVSTPRGALSAQRSGGATAALVAQNRPAGAAPAQAGAGTATQAGAGAGELQEVVVTAERRATDIQKTPVAVEAVTDQALVNAGADDLENIQKVAPDLEVTRQAAGATVAIRGVYTVDNSPTSETAVGVYFDNAFLSKSQGLEGFLFDVQRVEVDKGPQGTLFGADTNGGAVNIIPNRAQLGSNISGEGEVEYGSYDTLRTEGWVNMPMTDTFAVRGAFQTLSHEGYMDSGLDDEDLHSGRLSALWEPSGRDTFTLVGDYSTDSSLDDEAVQNVIGVEPVAKAATNIYVPSNPRNDTFYYGSVNSPTGSFPWHRDSLMQGLTAQNDFDAGFATWTTVLAYRHFNIGPSINPNNVTQGDLALAPDGVISPGAARNWVPLYYQSYSVETRLASNNAAQPLQWVAGIYLYQDHDSGTMIGYSDTVSTVPSIQIANPYELAQSGAVFGQLTYTPAALPKLHITVGGRGDQEHKTVKNIFTQFGTLPVAAVIPEADHTWGAGTYRGELSYDLTANSMLYADTATGFKAGGYGYGPGVNAKIGPIYEPEKITAYEFGSKNRFLDQTLQVNLEAWYYKYSDYLTNVVEFGAGSPLPVLTVESAGQATYKGATADIQWLATHDDQLDAVFSWLYGRYGTYYHYAGPGFSLAPGPVAVTTQNWSGTPITNVPDWTGTVSYVHTWPGVLGGSLQGEVDSQLRGHVVLDYEFDGSTPLELTDGAWAMFDLALQYQPDGANWYVRAYAHNITNAIQPVNGTINTTTWAELEAWFPPRIIGVIVSGRF